MKDKKYDISEIDFSYFISDGAANNSLGSSSSGQDTQTVSTAGQSTPYPSCPPIGQGYTPTDNNVNQVTSVYAQNMARQYEEQQRHQSRIWKKIAFISLYSSASHVYAYDEWRRPSTIISSGIEYCKFIKPSPEYQFLPFYAIKLKEHSTPLMISQSDLLNKNQFTQFLAQQLNVDIDTHRYRARLLTALQNFFQGEAVRVVFPFYYGWEMRKSRWEYTTFTLPQNNGRLPIRTTHGKKDFDWHSCLECIAEAGHAAPLSLNASVQLTAASQAVTSMEAIHNTSLHKFLWLLIHIVSMYSLLIGTKNRVPFGICFYSENEKALTPLKTLLSWFQDDPIKLTEGKNRFVTLLAERKDQPLLILDSEGQIPNSKLLEQGIDTNHIECGKKSYPLQALPIVLSNVLSHITQSKKFICLNLDDDDFRPYVNRVFSESCDYLMDYLHYFNLYVQEHQQMILNEKFAPVSIEPSESDMTMDCYDTLKIFHAVENTVASYYQTLHPSEEIRKQFDNLLSGDIEQYLVPILKQTAIHDDNATIREVFFSTANRMIQDDLFDIRTFDSKRVFFPCAEGKKGIIYIYENEPCLYKDAFGLIVSATGYGHHAIVRALKQTNAFRGTPISSNAPQYRLPVTNPYTGHHFTPVYRFASDSMTLPSKASAAIEEPKFKDPSECDFTIQLGTSLDNCPINWNGENNSHICISGKTGTGKSYFLKKIIAQLPDQGVRCIIFDTSGDFSDISKKSPDNWPIDDLEIFDMEDTQAQKLFFKLHSENDSMDKVAQRFVDALCRQYNIGKNQKDSISYNIKGGSAEICPTNFNDLIYLFENDKLYPQNSYPQVITTLKQLDSILPLGKVPFDWKMDSPGITVLNFHNGRDDESLRTVIELLLSTICAERMYTKQKSFTPVVLVFDECQLYDWTKDSFAYVIMVRGRKYAMAEWISTQSLKFINNPEILQQADLRVFFKPTEKEIPRIARSFYSSSDKDKKDWKSALNLLVRGQFICNLHGKIIQSQAPTVESKVP